MDRQLLRQNNRQKIQTNIFVFVVFKTKHELKCQNELFLNTISLETTVFMFSLLRLFDKLLTEFDHP